MVKASGSSIYIMLVSVPITRQLIASSSAVDFCRVAKHVITVYNRVTIETITE